MFITPNLFVLLKVKSFIGEKKPYKHSRAAKKECEKIPAKFTKLVSRWLQKTFGSCHHCQRVCNKIIYRGVIIAEQKILIR